MKLEDVLSFVFWVFMAGLGGIVLAMFLIMAYDMFFIVLDKNPYIIVVGVFSALLGSLLWIMVKTQK